MGMLLAIMIITIVVALSSYYLSKYRINDHIYQNYSGTFQLIGEGVSRHSGEQRQQWIAAIERLSDLTFKQYSFSDGLLSERQVGRLLNDKFLYQVDASLSSSQAYILLPENQGFLEVRLKDFGSSLIRISAFLMLNELGRHKKEQRANALEHLREIFGYPIQLKKTSDLAISTTHLRTIKKGDIAVVIEASGIQTPTMTAYAPIGNTSYALVLGSIPFFEWFPLPMIITMISIVLLFMAAASFYLVKPLERRLAIVDKKIELIGQDKEISNQAPKGLDAIGKLTNTVNSMASRIHKLIDAQDDMIRAISHELRAPIARIRFRLAAIECQPQRGGEIEGIERNLDELETLIDEVLTFSKLKSHQPELAAEFIDVHQFLFEIIKKQEAIPNSLTVSVCETTADSMRADKRYLFRAISNLYINATKYAQTKIELGYQADNKEQMIWVADDGPGIPKEKRGDIFIPFKRLDASRDRQSGGYGLGLAIVQQVAKWHGGDATIEQSSWGGTKVIFRWPIIKAGATFIGSNQ